MGRNAKFYKSAKAKKKQSSIQVEATTPLKSASQRSIQLSNSSAHVEEEGEETQADGTSSIQPASSFALGGSSSKLKSKLWKGLEAQRAKQGKREYSTPREAGIDYLRQWEKKKRR